MTCYSRCIRSLDCGVLIFFFFFFFIIIIIIIMDSMIPK